MVAVMRVYLPLLSVGRLEAVVGLVSSSGSRDPDLLPSFMLHRRESYPVGWESGSEKYTLSPRREKNGLPFFKLSYECHLAGIRVRGKAPMAQR